MTSVIADILKSKLEDFPWMDESGRIAGLAQVANRPILKYVEGSNDPAIVGYQTSPVACGVNLADCWEGTLYKDLEPNSSKSAVAFFVDMGGTRFLQTEGPKRAWLRFRFELKLVVWLNLQKLGEDITAGSCQPSGRISPYVMGKMFGAHSASGLFGGGVEETIFQSIDVTQVSEYAKNVSVFNPFTFATDNEKRGLFLYPYDYFALNISGEYVINKYCLPELVDNWTPAEGCADVPHPDDGFCRRLLRCLGNIGAEGETVDGLTFMWTLDNDVQVPGNVLRCIGTIPAADSDEEGLLIGTEVDGFVYYWTSDNHVQAPGGLLKRLAI